MIARHPWFGPRWRIGWGWTSVSWEGRLLTALFAVAIVGIYTVLEPGPIALYIIIASFAALLMICWLTATPPS